MSLIADLLSATTTVTIFTCLVIRRREGYLALGASSENLSMDGIPDIGVVAGELTNHPTWGNILLSESLTQTSDAMCNTWLIDTLEQMRRQNIEIARSHPVPLGAFRLKQAFLSVERHLTQANAPIPPEPALTFLRAQQGGLASILLRHIPFLEFKWDDPFCYHRYGRVFSLIERTGSSNEDMLRCYFPGDGVDMAKLFEIGPHEFLCSHALNFSISSQGSLPELTFAP